jgi:hypothetical protein
VHDPARLFLGDEVDLATLQFGKRLEHAHRQRRIDWQRHVRTDQRVTAEQGHVPRRSGGNDRSVTAGGVVQAQRGDVFDRAVVCRAQLPIGAAQLGNRRQPTFVSLRRVRQVGVMVPAFDPRAAEGNGEIELQHAHAVALDVDAPQESVRRHLHRRPVDAELGLAMNVAEPPSEQQAVLLDLQRVLAFAARPPFLDGEDVGKVGRNLQFDNCRDRRRRRVAQLDLFVPYRSQLAPAHDQNSRVRLVLGEGAPYECAPARVDEADGQRLDGDAADEQPGLAEHAHVGEEHAMCGIGAEVTRSSAETKRLAVDQRDETRRVSETRRFAGQYPRTRLHMSSVH